MSELSKRIEKRLAKIAKKYFSKNRVNEFCKVSANAFWAKSDDNFVYELGIWYVLKRISDSGRFKYFFFDIDMNKLVMVSDEE